MNSIRCKKLLENTGKKTCDICIAYVDEQKIAPDAIADATRYYYYYYYYYNYYNIIIVIIITR